MAHRILLCAGLMLTMSAIAACGNEAPGNDEIVAALERTSFMTEKITADRISSIECTPMNSVHSCIIAYRTQKQRAAGEIGIDKISKLHLQFELVGKRWRVSRIVLI